jgi:hypothetical protein
MMMMTKMMIMMTIIWCGEKIMNFVFMNFSPALCNFLRLRSKYTASPLFHRNMVILEFGRLQLITDQWLGSIAAQGFNRDTILVHRVAIAGLVVRSDKE